MFDPKTTITHLLVFRAPRFFPPWEEHPLRPQHHPENAGRQARACKIKNEQIVNTAIFHASFVEKPPFCKQLVTDVTNLLFLVPDAGFSASFYLTAGR